MKGYKFKEGDRVVITKGEEPFFKTGDIATLAWLDRNGDWWANFDIKKEYCLQKYFSKFKLLEEKKTDYDKLKAVFDEIVVEYREGRSEDGKYLRVYADRNRRCFDFDFDLDGKFIEAT